MTNNNILSSWDTFLQQTDAELKKKTAVAEVRTMLPSFLSLDEKEKQRICDTLIRYEFAEELISHLHGHSEAIPQSSIKGIYKSLTRGPQETPHPFIRSENGRFQDVVRGLLLDDKITRLTEDNDPLIERLFSLLEVYGEKGEVTAISIGTALYRKFNRLPAVVWEKYGGDIKQKCLPPSLQRGDELIRRVEIHGGSRSDVFSTNLKTALSSLEVAKAS